MAGARKTKVGPRADLKSIERGAHIQRRRRRVRRSVGSESSTTTLTYRDRCVALLVARRLSCGAALELWAEAAAVLPDLGEVQQTAHLRRYGRARGAGSDDVQWISERHERRRRRRRARRRSCCRARKELTTRSSPARSTRSDVTKSEIYNGSDGVSDGSACDRSTERGYVIQRGAAVVAACAITLPTRRRLVCHHLTYLGHAEVLARLHKV